MRIYLAGPLGFTEAGRYYKDHVLAPALQEHGLIVVDPWSFTEPHVFEAICRMPAGDERIADWRALNRSIGGKNVDAIDSCDVMAAVLDGADVDSGTAAEIGYAFARQKLIFGYRGDLRLSSDNEGAIVNLQVEYFVLASGGEIVSSLSDLLKALTRARAHLTRKSM